MLTNNTFELTCHINGHLTEHEQTRMVALFTPEEFAEAVKSLNFKSAAGLDGLVLQFYRKFELFLTNALLLVFNSLWTVSKIDPGFTEAKVCPIIKKRTVPPSGDNLRLISCFNFDYKILTKMMFFRLKSVIPSLLNENQYGVPGGKQMSVYLQQIRDVLHYVGITNTQDCFLLTIDFKDAFNHVSLQYLTQVLVQCEFPAKFIGLLMSLLQSRTAKLMINKSVQRPYNLRKSISQGCVLSTLLFALVMMPLINRLENVLTGIKVNGTMLKLLNYVDDLTVIVRSPSDIQKFFTILDEFTSLSGIPVNFTKTKLLVGKHTPEIPPALGLDLVQSVKILGVTWFMRTQDTIRDNGNRVCQQMIHSLVAHVHSFVNLTQRVKFVNEFVFTKALHLLQLFDFTNAQWAKINKFVGFFLWRGSILKINRQTLTLPCHAGGLNLWDLRLKGKALRIRRTLQIISEYDHTVSSALFTTIFHHMTLDTPLDINLWKHICPYLQ